MAAEQRKLLEQLMGASVTSQAAKVSFSDPKLCRSYIAGTCPHILFTNTKQDLGPCPKIHSEALKTEYDAMSERDRSKLGFEYDYIRHLYQYIDECNRGIEAAQRRLKKTPEEIRQTNIMLKEISDLNTSIHNGLLEVEILGAVSEVSRAQEELFRARQAMQAKADKERELKALADTSGPSGHQKLQVCDVCGAYLSRLDNDRRLADHFYGKMHLGFAQMRKTYDAFPREMKARARTMPSHDDDGPGGGGGGGPRGPRGHGGGGGGGGGYRGKGGRGYRGGW